jgi:hypothetical protein
MTQANLGGKEPHNIGATISSGAIDSIAVVLHTGFNALCECGLDAKSMTLVDDVYAMTVNALADVIEKGNPAFDKKKFLIAVWASDRKINTPEPPERAEPGSHIHDED